MALVITVASSHLQLKGIDPETGAVKWTVPYSASYITPGVTVLPVAIDGVALALVPGSNPASPVVTLRGVSVMTGKTVWSGPKVLAIDVPTPCPGSKNFCIDESPAAGSVGLAVLNPRSGKRLKFISGLERLMMPGLYQSTATTPTLKAIDSSGKVVWTRTVSSLFGGTNYNPDGGWDFLAEGRLDVGSVGDIGSPSTPPPSVPLGALRTIGVSPTTGAVRWSDPGEFDCMGSVSMSTVVLCKYSGTAHYHGTKLSLAGVGLSLEGLNTATGAITWSRKVSDVAQLTYGTSLRMSDGQHLFVTLIGGHKGILDLKTGVFHAVRSSTVLWCQSFNAYSVVAVVDDPAHGKKVGTFRYLGCTPTSPSSSSIPPVGSKVFGVEAGGRFVWPSPHGLEAALIPDN